MIEHKRDLGDPPAPEKTTIRVGLTTTGFTVAPGAYVVVDHGIRIAAFTNEKDANAYADLLRSRKAAEPRS